MISLSPMRRVAVLLCVAAVVSLAATSASAAEFSAQQRQAIEGIVKDYLASHPEIVVDALQAADAKMKGQAQDKAASALTTHRREVFDDPASPVGGNPEGDVTLVEFFDYRCPYCKQVEPALESLLRQDHDLRIVYKEFPVLGPASVTAAKAALAAQKQGKFAAFHRAMMALKGQIDDAAVFTVAGSVGLRVGRLKREMQDPAITQQLKANFALAEALNIDGTPGFVIGDQIVPGAIGLDDLKELIAATRKQAPRG
ncbi:MAG TPA: DsbA family protein [Stellaceae bacterium]|nr:DsbA family protein [Stellaceae bacterium]